MLPCLIMLSLWIRGSSRGTTARSWSATAQDGSRASVSPEKQRCRRTPCRHHAGRYGVHNRSIESTGDSWNHVTPRGIDLPGSLTDRSLAGVRDRKPVRVEAPRQTRHDIRHDGTPAEGLRPHTACGPRPAPAYRTGTRVPSHTPGISLSRAGTFRRLGLCQQSYWMGYATARDRGGPTGPARRSLRAERRGLTLSMLRSGSPPGVELRSSGHSVEKRDIGIFKDNFF